jgi:tetratricopeptide (TPR) repeat protein
LRPICLACLIAFCFIFTVPPAGAEPIVRRTGYAWIGWLNGEFVTVEESIASHGAPVRRLQAINPATMKTRLLLESSARDPYNQKAAFAARVQALRTTCQPGIAIKAMPCVAKTAGTAEMVSTPIALFPEQTPTVRSRAVGRYFLDLVSARNNFQPITELTPWLRQEHPDIFKPELVWGPKFYLEEIAVAPQGLWAAIIVEVRYAVQSRDNEVVGAKLAFFRANKSSARLYNLDGYKAYRFKEYYTAIPYFQWAALQDPAFDIPIYNLACTYGLLGLDDPAIACLIQSIRMNPRNKTKAIKDPDLEKLQQSGKLDALLK